MGLVCQQHTGCTVILEGAVSGICEDDEFVGPVECE
jgi:hypothetical protein